MCRNCHQVSRIQKLHQTSADYVKNVIPKGYSVGIVTYNGNAATVATLREITSDSVRDELVAVLPLGVESATATGKGLLQGVMVNTVREILVRL